MNPDMTSELDRAIRLLMQTDDYKVTSRGENWAELIYVHNSPPHPVTRIEVRAGNKPADQELFNRTAPAWNCVDYPRDGMHYVPETGSCRWCGMTSDQIREEWREVSAEWEAQRSQHES